MEARRRGLVLQRYEGAPGLGMRLFARKARCQHPYEAPRVLPLRVREERGQGDALRRLAQDAARHPRKTSGKGHLRQVLPLVPVGVGLEVVHPRDHAPARHVLRLGGELDDSSLRATTSCRGVTPRPARVQRPPPQVPVLHAVATLAATARRISWPKSCWILTGLLGPALLDLAVLGAPQQIMESVPHLRASEVVDELKPHRVEISGSLRRAFPILGSRLALRVGGAVLEGALALLPLQLLALARLALPLLLGPAALDDEAQGVQVFRQALVRLPRGASLPDPAVLRVAVVSLVVRRPPLDHVEVLVDAALGVQERLPGREVLRQALHGEPALLGLALTRRAAVLQLPAVGGGPCGAPELRPGDRNVRQLLGAVQEGA
mmetsp:Transcript_72444/g.223874  ORF Transcript_72444/g.223874 Transcript_72444/m.223874 type:complete len:378 (-) Transcript_72444:472-1605(-)